MPILIICIAGGMAFLLIFLRACLGETRRNKRRPATVLHFPQTEDLRRRRAGSAGGRP